MMFEKEYAINITAPVLKEARLIAYQIQRRNHLSLVPASEDFLGKDDHISLNKSIFQALFNNQNDDFFDGLKEALALNFIGNRLDELKKCFTKVKKDASQDEIRNRDNLFEPRPILFGGCFHENKEDSNLYLKKIRLKLLRNREAENNEYLD